jgi:hypothetical protein
MLEVGKYDKMQYHDYIEYAMIFVVVENTAYS